MDSPHGRQILSSSCFFLFGGCFGKTCHRRWPLLAYELSSCVCCERSTPLSEHITYEPKLGCRTSSEQLLGQISVQCRLHHHLFVANGARLCQNISRASLLVASSCLVTESPQPFSCSDPNLINVPLVAAMPCHRMRLSLSRVGSMPPWSQSMVHFRVGRPHVAAVHSRSTRCFFKRRLSKCRIKVLAEPSGA